MPIYQNMQIPVGKSGGALPTDDNAGYSVYVPGSKNVQALDSSGYALAARAGEVIAESQRNMLEGVQTFGRSLKKVGDVAWEIEQKNRELDMAKAEDMLAQYTNNSQLEVESLMERRGGNALGVGKDESGKPYTDIGNDWSRFTSDQKKLFAPDVNKLGYYARRHFYMGARETDSRNRVRVEAHRDNERLSYIRSSLEAGTEASSNVIVSSGGDQNVVARELGGIKARAELFAQANGLPSEAVDGIMRELTGKIAQRSVGGALAVNDLPGALKRLEALKNSGYLTEDAAQTLMGDITETAIRLDAQAADLGDEGVHAEVESLFHKSSPRASKAPKEYREVVAQAAADAKCPENIVWGMMKIESSMSADANIKSHKGAIGPMQITQGTWNSYAKPGEKINNWKDNVRVGARILGAYYKRYNGDIDKIAIAYNAGPGAVGKPLEQLQPETRTHIQRFRDALNTSGNPRLAMALRKNGENVRDNATIKRLAPEYIKKYSQHLMEDPVEASRKLGITLDTYFKLRAYAARRDAEVRQAKAQVLADRREKLFNDPRMVSALNGRDWGAMEKLIEESGAAGEEKQQLLDIAYRYYDGSARRDHDLNYTQMSSEFAKNPNDREANLEKAAKAFRDGKISRDQYRALEAQIRDESGWQNSVQTELGRVKKDFMASRVGATSPAYVDHLIADAEKRATSAILGLPQEQRDRQAIEWSSGEQAKRMGTIVWPVFEDLKRQLTDQQKLLADAAAWTQSQNEMAAQARQAQVTTMAMRMFREGETLPAGVSEEFKSEVQKEYKRLRTAGDDAVRIARRYNEAAYRDPQTGEIVTSRALRAGSSDDIARKSRDAMIGGIGALAQRVIEAPLVPFRMIARPIARRLPTVRFQRVEDGEGYQAIWGDTYSERSSNAEGIMNGQAGSTGRW